MYLIVPMAEYRDLPSSNSQSQLHSIFATYNGTIRLGWMVERREQERLHDFDRFWLAAFPARVDAGDRSNDLLLSRCAADRSSGDVAARSNLDLCRRMVSGLDLAPPRTRVGASLTSSALMPSFCTLGAICERTLMPRKIGPNSILKLRFGQRHTSIGLEKFGRFYRHVH